jgi:hypothetical protein
MSGERLQYQYAAVRLVPRVERGEGFNVAVVLFCRQADFLGVRAHLDEQLLARFAPDSDHQLVRDRLALLERIAAGAADAGPIAKLSTSERYHWLVAPSSTILQPAPAHTGLATDPAAQLDHLFTELVSR